MVWLTLSAVSTCVTLVYCGQMPKMIELVSGYEGYHRRLQLCTGLGSRSPTERETQDLPSSESLCPQNWQNAYVHRKCLAPAKPRPAIPAFSQKYFAVPQNFILNRIYEWSQYRGTGKKFKNKHNGRTMHKQKVNDTNARNSEQIRKPSKALWLFTFFLFDISIRLGIAFLFSLRLSRWDGWCSGAGGWWRQRGTSCGASVSRFCLLHGFWSA